jgi:hypothetical protein
MYFAFAVCVLSVFACPSGLVQIYEASEENFLRLISSESVTFLFVGDESPGSRDEASATAIEKSRKGLAEFLASKNAADLRSIALPAMLISDEVVSKLSRLANLETVAIFGPVDLKSLKIAKFYRLRNCPKLRLVAIADPQVEKSMLVEVITDRIDSSFQIEVAEVGKDSLSFDSNGCPTRKFLSEKFGFQLSPR